MFRELAIAAALLAAAACGETEPGERTATAEGGSGGAQAGSGGMLAGGAGGEVSGGSGAVAAGNSGDAGSAGSGAGEGGAGGVVEPQGGLGGLGQAGEAGGGLGGESAAGDGGALQIGGAGGYPAGGQGGSEPAPVMSTCEQEDRDTCYSMGGNTERGFRMCTDTGGPAALCLYCGDDLLDCNKADGDGCETSRLDPLNCGRCGHYCAESSPYCHPGGLCKVEPY